ncbi:MAG: alanine--glyoxylate aminotransferase family protein [Candidatus Helarchaeota archaeon]|nr:alanine--glyoxylate aminotransferase family protein [Candidatus Helarchaeota archaeon]
MIDNDTMLLMIPGPVKTHPRIYAAMARPLIGHRTPEFKKLYNETLELFKKLIDTKNDAFIFTGSSTSAMDSAIANLVQPGDKVLNVIQGKFSERWQDITNAYGGDSIVLNIEWGKALKEEPLVEMFDKNKDIKFVTICHNETSTGIINPAEKIGKVVRDYEKILIVDGVTSVGGDYVYPDKWNFDILVTGSQKCLGIPPGLGFIMVGPRAWEIINERESIHSYYVNLPLYKQWFAERGDTPFTPSVPLIIAQNVSLKMMFEEGIDNRMKRHRRMAKATRVGAKALGLQLFAEEEYASNTVTSIKVPPKINSKELINSMKELGILIAGGQGNLRGNIIRIAHMNVVQEKDILVTFSALETALNKLGFDFKPGSGVAAIEQEFSQTS